MLETIKQEINKNENLTFEQKYVNYLLSVQNLSIKLELDYIKKHNKLDVMKLDRVINRLINSSFEKVASYDISKTDTNIL